MRVLSRPISDKKGSNIPNSGNGKGEGNSPFPPLSDTLTTSITSAVVAILTVGLTTYGYKYVQEKGENLSNKELQLSNTLSNVKLQQKKGNFDLVEMPQLQSKLRSLILNKSPRVNETIMICGPRGVGKSTLVSSSLAGIAGVVHICVEGKCAMDDFETNILEVVKFKSSDLPKKNLIHQALCDITNRGRNPPIIVVEVNSQCDDRSLCELLLRMKEWGADENLAKFVIILSLTRAALTIPIGLSELRVNSISIKDPSKDIIAGLLHRFLTKYDVTKEEKDQFVHDYISKIGTRFLNAQTLISRCLEQCTTFSEVRAVSDEYSADLVGDCERALFCFLELEENLCNNKEVLEKLVAENVEFTQLCKALKMTHEKALDELAKLHPHPIYVDPKTKQVSMGNYIAKKALQKFVQNM